jgi:EpsI family protein
MKRYGFALALLALTAAYVIAHPPENLAMGGAVLAAIPRTLGPWSGAELSFEDAVVDELKADDLLVRRYERGDDLVWLCVVYHQNRRYGSHDPHLCYESQGYSIERERQGPIAAGAHGSIQANWFVAVRPKHPRLVAYWWTTQGLDTRDADEFRNRMALSGALENRSWGAFVRVETPIRNDDEAAAVERLHDFAGEVARVLPSVFADSARVVRPG